MRKRLIIQNSNDVNAPYSWCLFDHAPSSIEHRGNLQALAAAVNMAANTQIVLLVPSEYLLLTQVNLPTRNRQQRLQAIPFALEEQVASDIDDLHFAIGHSSTNSSTPVVVVERRWMAAWLEPLQQAGIQPDIVTANVLALPLLEDTWTLLVERDITLIRTGQSSGFAVDTPNLEFILKITLEQTQQPPSKIHLFKLDDTLVARSAVLGKDNTTEQIIDRISLMTRFNRDLQFSDVINLRQGIYDRKAPMLSLLKPWSRVAAVLVLFYVFQFGMLLWENYVFERHISEVGRQIEQLYRQTFPNAQKIVNARWQMEQQWIALQKKTGSNVVSSEFLTLLATAGPMVRQAEDIQINHLMFQSKTGVLDMVAESSSLQALESIRQHLSEDTPFSVEMLNVVKIKNKAKGRLKIMQKPS